MLRTDGRIVVASPGPDHFAGLTSLIYESPEPHDQRTHTESATERVRYELSLGQPDLVLLLQMTPYWWKATVDQQADLAIRSELTVTIDIVIATIRSRSSAYVDG